MISLSDLIFLSEQFSFQELVNAYCATASGIGAAVVGAPVSIGLACIGPRSAAEARNGIGAAVPAIGPGISSDRFVTAPAITALNNKHTAAKCAYCFIDCLPFCVGRTDRFARRFAVYAVSPPAQSKKSNFER
jgi:hypothetical protein